MACTGRIAKPNRMTDANAIPKGTSARITWMTPALRMIACDHRRALSSIAEMAPERLLPLTWARSAWSRQILQRATTPGIIPMARIASALLRFASAN